MAINSSHNDKTKHRISIGIYGNKYLFDESGRGGGVEVVVAEVARRQAALGYDVTVYNRSDSLPDKSYRLTEWEGVHMKYVPTIPRSGLAAVSASFCAALCCAFGKYDVVHIHAEGPAAFCWIPKLLGKKIICHNHGMDWMRDKWKKGASFGSRFIKFGEKMSAIYADELIVLSAEIQDCFKGVYGRETHLIPNGISRPEVKMPKMITEKYGLVGQDYLLYLSRITPEKRPDLLIEAYKKLNTDKKLVIAGGDGENGNSLYFQQLKEAAGNDSRILFTGFVGGRLLEELYSNAYVYVLPSDLEGMPLCLLEAMSYGNCCLTSDIPECTNVIDQFGASFNRGSEEFLLKELQALLDNVETVKQLKAGAADHVCKKYNWDDVTDQINKLYRKPKRLEIKNTGIRNKRTKKRVGRL